MKPILVTLLILLCSALLIGTGAYSLIQKQDWVKGILCLSMGGAGVWWAFILNPVK